MRPDIPALIRRHRRLFFVVITNGSLLTPGIAGVLRAADNVMVLVSIEGSREDTDSRRGEGAQERALGALGLLRDRAVFHGFATTAHAINADRVSSGGFIDEMTALGCTTGYYTEYVPCDENPRTDWIFGREARERFRGRILELRRTKRLILVQFPQDEYGSRNLCTAAGRFSLHIGPRGDIEPCPFVPVSCENVRDGGLAAAIRSPFLRAIRERTELLRRDRFACALFEHLAELVNLKALRDNDGDTRRLARNDAAGASSAQ